MIVCENLKKNFDTQIVIKSFTYKFKDTGFYLLFGESGSGKTTFLNILAGFLPFESGMIKINENVFSKKVDRKTIEKDIDYITQDTFFVDFLTVYDNLRMIVDDDLKIQETLKMFGLSDKFNQFPPSLSGGEKQRLAIARSILGNKKILFLDEPTAALDSDNKIFVFEMLSKIKKDVLIICSSHDAEAKDYADEIISFDKIHEPCEPSPISKPKKQQPSNTIRTNIENKKKVSFFVKQWFKSKRRNKKSEILFGIFMTIAILLCALTDTPQNKLDSNIEYVYKVNMCRLDTNDTSPDLYHELCKADGITEVVISYGRNLPDSNNNNDDLIHELPDYETSGYVLPSDKTAFKLSDQIKYGTYFTDTNQIILTYNMAVSLSPDAPEKLINQTITKNYYSIGNIDLKIVGIMDELTDIEKKYLNAMEMYDENTWFLNSDFTKQYITDEEFNNNGKRSYMLFFDSYRSMKTFYNENYDKYNENGSLILGLTSTSELDVFITMFRIFLPMSFLIAVFTILFYINLIKTEIAYNNKFISVFDYAGYPVNKVINCFIRLNLIHLLKICVICAMVAFGITYFVNLTNQKFIFIDFQIFTYNAGFLSAFIVGIILISAAFMNIILRRLKFTGWYENIIIQRDLI